MNKAERQREYQKRYLATMKEKNCLCGSPAVRRYRNYPACQTCIDIEEKLEEIRQRPKTETGLPEYTLHLKLS